MFAHRHAEEARNRTGRADCNPNQPSALDLGVGRGDHGDAKRGVGELGEGAGDLVEVPEAAEVGQGGQQVQFGLQFA